MSAEEEPTNQEQKEEAGSKTKEEQLREQEQAKEQLDALLKQTRPKNIGNGLISGVSNIVGGAVGCVGVVVLAPVVGATVGAQSAGVVGGAAGLVGGAVVGVVGGAAVLVGGTVQGVIQIGRGVAAQPDAIIQPSKGKWWNENEAEWIETNLADEAAALEGVPKYDEDLLGAAEEEAASAAGEGGGSGNVKDMYYYDCLEIAPDAEQGKIKRQYYLLARKYHPDKVGPDDKVSADKFKEIAEAYQVLSDPQLRAAYDRDGRDGLSGDKTETNEDGQPKVDPALLFAFLFGSDKFHGYTGRLAMASSALTGDSPKISSADARKLQQRRCARLAIELAERLEVWTAELYEPCKAKWQTEAEELSKASYGSEMIHLIGQVYSLAAVQFLGRMDSGIGNPSISDWASSKWAKMKKGKASTANKVETVKAAMETMQMQKNAEAELANAKTEEEKRAAEAKINKDMAVGMLRVMWTITVVDVTGTLYETIQMVLFDQSVPLDIRKRRAHGIKKLGEIFMECPGPEKKDGEETDAQQLYEEAAFAAMLEAIKRKDEAYNAASVKGGF